MIEVFKYVRGIYQSAPLNFCQEHLSVLRGHDYKLMKRHCHSHARLSFFFRVVIIIIIIKQENDYSDVRQLIAVARALYKIKLKTHMLIVQ